MREALGLPRDLKAEAVGPAQGDLCTSSPPTLPTHWEPAGDEGLGRCIVPLVMGGHLLQSPNSPEPQAIRLRLPQRQSQIGPQNPSKCGYSATQSYAGGRGYAWSYIHKHTAASRCKLGLEHRATPMGGSDRTGTHTSLATYSYTW